MNDPLASRIRPTELSDVVGQRHLLAPGKPLYNLIQSGNIPNLIFYGPSGTGKTTVASIIAKKTNKALRRLNGTNASTKDIKEIVSELDTFETVNGVLLYLDEIQYFNKKQQQTLLPYIESGTITLIAATTENPYHNIYKALLSRCMILEFKALQADDIENRLRQIVKAENIENRFEQNTLHFIAQTASGDARSALNTLELTCAQHPQGTISVENVKNLLPSVMAAGFDQDGDSHYQYVSALQKSIRGSDPNAAVFYLAKLLEGGDILSPCRRLLVIAHEDIGLGNPNAAAFVMACVEAAQQLGMPEAAKPLTNAVIYLAISRKCSTAETTYNKVLEDIHAGKGMIIPPYLRQAHAHGYLYPHNYPNHWVPQQYLPDDCAGHIYYTPGDNPFEQEMARYWANIMCRKP